MNKNIFDLDMQVNKINGAQNAPQRITSKSFCTPGTCNPSCKTNTTLNSDCCPNTTTTTTTMGPTGTTTTTTTASAISCFCKTQLNCK